MALIIPGMVSAFGIYMAKQFIEDIPDSICEAAKIDGASAFGIYWKIILPNIRPAIGSLGIFTAMMSWNDYLNPLLMLNDKEKMTLPLALVVFSTEHTQDLTTTMAAATMIMLPMIVIFILFQKTIYPWTGAEWDKIIVTKEDSNERGRNDIESERTWKETGKKSSLWYLCVRLPNGCLCRRWKDYFGRRKQRSAWAERRTLCEGGSCKTVHI
ncbi:MAG: carbohydrate ABC transporter permease [Faecalimonas umbilicata]